MTTWRRDGSLQTHADVIVNVTGGVDVRVGTVRPSKTSRSLEHLMKHRGLCVALVFLAAWIAIAAGQHADRSALLRSLPRVTNLPSSYRPIGVLADRGAFYATQGGSK